MKETLKKVAAWHDEEAAHGGASREWHERAASACRCAAFIEERRVEVLTEALRLSRPDSNVRYYLAEQLGMSIVRQIVAEENQK